MTPDIGMSWSWNHQLVCFSQGFHAKLWCDRTCPKAQVQAAEAAARFAQDFQGDPTGGELIPEMGTSIPRGQQWVWEFGVSSVLFPRNRPKLLLKHNSGRLSRWGDRWPKSYLH